MYKVIIAAILSICVLLAKAQDKSGADDRRIIPTAEMKEHAEQQLETLQKADFARLEIALLPCDPPGKESVRSYKEEEDIRLQVKITNAILDRVIIPISDSYYENRPQLMKEGQSVPFRKSIGDLLEKKDKEQLLFSIRPIDLKLNESLSESFNLNYWYEPFAPGRYELTMKHQFVQGGRWIESNTITFDVLPK